MVKYILPKKRILPKIGKIRILARPPLKTYFTDFGKIRFFGKIRILARPPPLKMYFTDCRLR